MTPEEHNKYVGIANVAYGVIHVLLMLVMAGFFMGIMGVIGRDTGRAGVPPPAFFGVIMAFAVGTNLLLAVPSFIAGYAFLKRKRWAKTAGIVAAVLSAIRVPFGTVVSIYTFWFLLSAPGKTLYDNLPQALPPAPPADWNEVNRTQRAQEYSGRPSPPDWR
jgi:hypothetical protein